MTRRTSLLLVAFALTGVLAIAAPVGLRIWRLVSFARQQRIGAELIGSLKERCPEMVPKKTWDDATGWAITAYHNVCFSESHVTIVEMVRFNHDARMKLAGNVDLQSVDWVWKRLAETGPHGQRYVDKFEPKYMAAISHARSTDTTQ